MASARRRVKREEPTTSQDQSQEEDATLAVATASAFLLTDAQVSALTSMIATAQSAAYRASYLQAAQDSGAELPQDWSPDPGAQSDLEERAQASAQSIAATHQRDLTAAALAFLATYRSDHDGDMAGAGVALGVYLHTWTLTRAVWKSKQVSTYETGVGGQAGTQDAIGDVIDGELLDAEGMPIDYSSLVVAVLPAESSSDFCADYAGKVYAYDDAPSLDFPAHANCIHYIDVLPASDLAA